MEKEEPSAQNTDQVENILSSNQAPLSLFTLLTTLKEQYKAHKINHHSSFNLILR